MKTRCIICAFLLLAGLTACQQKARWLKEAETYYQQGLEQRAAKQSESAAESFSQALIAIDHCNQATAESANRGQPRLLLLEARALRRSLTPA